jgi:16S rRNA (guanine966-N2)-methyltransferase
VRVIAGKYKRRLLKTLDGTEVTRPTSDRVKESLFNMLAPDISGAIVWDLFAGSGALGIEALSRGAEHVTFVEESSAAARMISENLKLLQVPAENYTLVTSTVEAFLTKKNVESTRPSANPARPVSVVLADPPYHSSWYDEALTELSGTRSCAEDCLVVLEMKTGRVVSQEASPQWEKVDERIYGIAQVQFWRHRGGEDR